MKAVSIGWLLSAVRLACWKRWRKVGRMTKYWVIERCSTTLGGAYNSAGSGWSQFTTIIAVAAATVAFSWWGCWHGTQRSYRASKRLFAACCRHWLADDANICHFYLLDLRHTSLLCPFLYCAEGTLTPQIANFLMSSFGPKFRTIKMQVITKSNLHENNTIVFVLSTRLNDSTWMQQK